MEKIKRTPTLVKVLKTLKEVNLEFLMVDSRTLITDHPKALVNLMGDRADTEVMQARAPGCYHVFCLFSACSSLFCLIIIGTPFGRS